MKASDTIFAVATAPGRAAVAVVRVSGPDAGPTLDRLAGARPTARTAALRVLKDEAGHALDTALTFWFPGPGSYTGEDVVELHLHGGRAIVDGVVRTLAARPGLRAAQPGEFTRRAFEHGKLDLAQAEAVADLIDAESDAQRRQALDQLGGALSRRHERWRASLLDALAWLEAAVDFPDEDVPEQVADRARPVLQALADDLEAAMQDTKRGQRVRDGYRVALIGAPNAGKSTLVNALAGRDVAIVTDVAGTTRDVIETPLLLGGYSVVLADTAGLRATEDMIEAEGVRRAEAWADSADLRLWIIDGVQPTPAPPPQLRDGDLKVVSKADLAPTATPSAPEAMRVSALQAQDVERLRDALTQRVIADLSGAEFPAATRARHAEALRDALASVRAGLSQMARPELAAEEVRRAAFVLKRVTGRVEVEQVLGRVFATFCIGK